MLSSTDRHIKRITLPARDTELARRFFRRCCELFGDDCAATVRKHEPQEDKDKK
jgi:hypothetical protein